MTIEGKRTMCVDDIKAFEITCTNCESTLSIPLDKCNKTAFQCPRCDEYWYAGGAAENEAITGLADAIKEIKAQSKTKKPKFRFRIEISCDDSTASRAPGVSA